MTERALHRATLAVTAGRPAPSPDAPLNEPVSFASAYHAGGPVAYADVDDLRLIGLVESDWPERSTRSIFYPQSLLAQLGWPSDLDRLAASRTRFQDLLRRVGLAG